MIALSAGDAKPLVGVELLKVSSLKNGNNMFKSDEDVRELMFEWIMAYEAVAGKMAMTSSMPTHVLMARFLVHFSEELLSALAQRYIGPELMDSVRCGDAGKICDLIYEFARYNRPVGAVVSKMGPAVRISLKAAKGPAAVAEALHALNWKIRDSLMRRYSSEQLKSYFEYRHETPGAVLLWPALGGPTGWDVLKHYMDSVASFVSGREDPDLTVVTVRQLNKVEDVVLVLEMAACSIEGVPAPSFTARGARMVSAYTRTTHPVPEVTQRQWAAACFPDESTETTYYHKSGAKAGGARSGGEKTFTPFPSEHPGKMEGGGYPLRHQWACAGCWARGKLTRLPRDERVHSKCPYPSVEDTCHECLCKSEGGVTKPYGHPGPCVGGLVRTVRPRK